MLAIASARIASKLAPTEVYARLLAVWQQAAGDAFDVTGFSDGRVNRVIRALAAAFQQLDVAIQMAGAGQ